MTDKTMNMHIIKALELKAQIKSLEKELNAHEESIKKGILESGKEEYKSSSHKATYKSTVQMRFNKEVFISRYSEQEYEECKSPTKRTYFTYA